MKITWKNIDEFKISVRSKKDKYTHYSINNTIYFCYCSICGDLYTNSRDNNTFCSDECKTKYYLGANNPFYGKDHSIQYKENLIKRNKIHKYRYNGGYNKENIPTFDTYSYQLKSYEEIRRSLDDKNILEVRCTYCNKWYISTVSNVRNRRQAIEGIRSGDHRLYCSDECKGKCDIFAQSKYPKGFKINTTREIQPQLRKIVLERDNYQCQICNSDKELHCHHYDGIEINPIESADIDNCVTLCKKCHNILHKDPNCDMRRKECKK